LIVLAVFGALIAVGLFMHYDPTTTHQPAIAPLASQPFGIVAFVTEGNELTWRTAMFVGDKNCDKGNWAYLPEQFKKIWCYVRADGDDCQVVRSEPASNENVGTIENGKVFKLRLFDGVEYATYKFFPINKKSEPYTHLRIKVVSGKAARLDFPDWCGGGLLDPTGRVEKEAAR